MSKLLHGDCLDLMQNIPDKSVDLILADLPYGITGAKWDSGIPLKPLWKQYKRIIKDHGAILLFGVEPFSSMLIASNLRMYRYNWIWKKTSGTGFLLSHKMPLKAYEEVCVFYKHLPTYNPQMRYSSKFKAKSRYIGQNTHTKYAKYRTNVLYSGRLKCGGNSPKGVRYPINVVTFSNSHEQGHRFHPTQKPTDLLRYMIKTYTNKNDLVLDNCMGSGSTGVAAKQLHRRFIGIEKNDHYFKVSKDRISKVKDKKLVKA